MIKGQPFVCCRGLCCCNQERKAEQGGIFVENISRGTQAPAKIGVIFALSSDIPGVSKADRKRLRGHELHKLESFGVISFDFTVDAGSCRDITSGTAKQLYLELPSL